MGSADRTKHHTQDKWKMQAMAKASGKQQKKKTNETTKWITRAGVGVILVTLVVLALMDRNAKIHATRTTTAWLNALQATTDEQHELFYSDLPQHVSGNPQITGPSSSGQVVYTWDGIFRSYTTSINCEGDAAPVVVRIEGPGS
jgi:hypothetical protein